MALKMVKGSIDRMFDKNLQDLVRGIRNHKEDEVSGPGSPPAPRRGCRLPFAPARAGPPHPSVRAVSRFPVRSCPSGGRGGWEPARSPQGGLRRAQGSRVSWPPCKGDVALGKVEAGIKRRKMLLGCGPAGKDWENEKALGEQ